MQARTHLRWLLPLLLIGVAGTLGAVARLGQPVRGFPSPGDYPEGLAWDGRFLWCNNFTDGALYKLDPADGHVVTVYRGGGLPLTPEGLAWDGQHLWTCDWQTGDIYELREGSGGIEIVAQHPKPANAGSTVGLAWDGSSIWLSCMRTGDTAQLFELDPTTLEVRAVRDLPVYNIEDLTWDGRWLWSFDWLFAIGFAIDPATGDTLHTYAAPGPNPVGSAWDGTHLWTTDTTADSIWALDISAAHPAAVHPLTWSELKQRFRGVHGEARKP